MADTEIHPLGKVATPADYEIPSSAEFILKTAFATFDGSAAAGSFLPLLRLKSDAGSTVIEAASDTAVAAGGSADVSWFQGVALLPSSSAVLPGTGLDRHVTSQVIPNNASTNISFDTVLFDDLGWFSAGSPTLITVSLPGQYLCIYTMAWVYPAAGGFSIQTGIGYNAGARALVSEQSTAIANTPNAHTGAAVVNANAGDTFFLFVYQNSGVNRSTWIAGSHPPDVQPFPTLTVIRVGDRV